MEYRKGSQAGIQWVKCLVFPKKTFSIYSRCGYIHYPVLLERMMVGKGDVCMCEEYTINVHSGKIYADPA